MAQPPQLAEHGTLGPSKVRQDPGHPHPTLLREKVTLRARTIQGIAIDMLISPETSLALQASVCPTPRARLSVLPRAPGNSPGVGRPPPLSEVTRCTPTVTEGAEKNNHVTFPKACLWDSRSVPFPPGANRCQYSKPTQQSGPSRFPVSSVSSWGNPRKAPVGVEGRGWALPGEECSETRNSMAGVGLRRRI